MVAGLLFECRCSRAAWSQPSDVALGGIPLPFDIFDDRSGVIVEASRHLGADFPQLRHDGIEFRILHVALR